MSKKKLPVNPKRVQLAETESLTGNNYEVFNEMLEGVQVIDRHWRYHYINSAVIKQGKSTKKELIGFTMMEKYPGIEKTELFKVIGLCMTDRIPQKLLNEFDFPDGSKGYFELRIQPVTEGVLILSIDVSEQKKLENDLRIFNERLEEMVFERTKELADTLEREKELNELKSKFVSMASHEFKTPLGAIEICVNVLEKHNVPPNRNERDKYHQYIKTSVKDMFQVLDDFLSLDRLEHGIEHDQKQSFDVHKSIEIELKKIEYTCKRGQKINYLHSGSSNVLMDKQILRCIVSNLVSNAIKYSDKDIEIRTQLNKKDLMLKVNDKGIGIPQIDQDKLFQKFFRASNTADIQGTGLGLTIVKRYVELLIGTINLSSKEGEGTTIKVQIPNGFNKQTAKDYQYS